jgi:hypothetical protein
MKRVFTHFFALIIFCLAMSVGNPVMAVDNLKKEEVRIYPNPMISDATIRFSDELDFNTQKIVFQVYNLVGEVVYRISAVKSTEVTLPREPFLRGMYFYQLNIDGKVVTTGKITVK